MTIVLGIESTAHTFGVGIVKDGKVLVNVKEAYTTEFGGIIPIDSAKHHEKIADELIERALKEAKVSWKEISAIAFSQGPGLAPCLLVGLKKAKELARKLDIPLVPVNHCVAHLEIGKITGANDPVLLYVSGANTQIIAYSSGKYRIFGETLDLGVGNFIDTFARYMDLGFPGGPRIEQLAKNSRNYIELPYTVKGMDIALSGILTNLRQKIEKMNKSLSSSPLPQNLSLHSSEIDKILTHKRLLNDNINNLKNQASEAKLVNYTKEDLAFSMQETVFAMLVEVAERALAHTGKKELLLGGGVACNSRLQEMCKIMCDERIPLVYSTTNFPPTPPINQQINKPINQQINKPTKLFIPPNNLLVDNGAMIGFLGEVMFNSGIKFERKKAEDLDIKPRERTDDVEVSWR